MQRTELTDQNILEKLTTIKNSLNEVHADTIIEYGYDDPVKKNPQQFLKEPDRLRSKIEFLEGFINSEQGSLPNLQKLFFEIDFIYRLLIQLNDVNKSVKNYLGIDSVKTQQDTNAEKLHTDILRFLERCCDKALNKRTDDKKTDLTTPNGQQAFKAELINDAEKWGRTLEHRGKLDTRSHGVLKIILNFFMLITVIPMGIKYLATDACLFSAKPRREQLVTEAINKLTCVK